MMLIADSGSTKTEWCAIAPEGNIRVRTQGISPYFLSTADIRNLLTAELLPSLSAEMVTDIFYYGTGCTAPPTIAIVSDALQQLFPLARINVTYDLVAAAHALCGREEGIACILGTGSNSGYYNGRRIEKNIPGLGYILGDEGSGAYLGKMFAARYLYDRLDRSLQQKFEEEFSIDRHTLLDKIYASTMANRLLASFSTFIGAHRSYPGVDDLLRRSIGDFFEVHLLGYEQVRRVPVHFTGSIAWAYKDMIQSLCDEYGFKCGHVIKEPMDRLLEFYQSTSFNQEV